jgi:hypothetical protein
MKRILLGLAMVGGLALMAAPKANAMSETAIPSLCSTAATTYSYAVLISASDPSVVTADGTATLPGALTSGFGVGVITFGPGSSTNGAGGQPGCAITTGELIYNVGDIQTNPLGFSFGPAYCYAPASAFGTGVPCFDGGDHITGNLTAGGPDGSFFLTFAAGYTWFDGSVASGTVPFGFWVNPTLGNSIAVGTTIPGAVDTTGCPAGCVTPGNGAPIGNILMQKQKAPPAATTFGVAPYVGASAISCEAFGANSTDLVALGQSAPVNGDGATVAGSAQDTLGSISNWNACQSGGSLSFNGNDNYVFPSTGSNPSNSNCAFNFFASECPVLPIPYDNLPSGTPFSEFADGGSNGIAFIGSSDSPCSNDLTADAGYETSGVRWGATDGNSYLIVTGLFSGADGALPVGGSSYCTEYEQSPLPGTITNLTTTTIVAVNSKKTGYVKVTNATEADCDIEISMNSSSNTITGASQDASCTGLRAPLLCCTGLHTGTCVDETCSLNLNTYPGDVATNPVITDAAGPIPSTELAETDCTCNGTSPANSTTSTLTLTSEACPLSGTTSYTVTCKN